MNKNKKIRELVSEALADVFESKTLKCRMYLLKYIYDKDEKYFNMFIQIFRKLRPEEQTQVMANIRANLIEQGVLKEQTDESEMVERTNRTLIRELGMPYDIFELLDFDEQQKLIENNRRKKAKKFNSDMVTVMIGSGEDAIFVEEKRGERYMLADGTIVIVGDTPEESRARLEDRLDDAIYSKPIAFVKKLSRRIKNR